MNESFRTKLMRYKFNFFPAYRRTGGRVTFISDNFKYVKIKLPLNWTTRNIVGTIFGGSIYSAVDPIYMVMFMKILGSEYIIWDKSAVIDFRRPGRDVLEAEFKIDESMVEDIIATLENKRSTKKTFVVELYDRKKVLCARVEKVLYFSKK